LKLARIELVSLLETYKIKHKATFRKNLAFVETKAKKDTLLRICKRSALIKWCVLEKDHKNLSWVKSPFCVRVKLGAKDERKIASQIWKRLKKPSVNLKNPRTTIYVIGNKLTKLIWKKEKSRFAGREPINKPAFHPTSLKPIWARLLVNLARCKEGEVLLDPFCGTGSILIEGAIIGCKVIGSDLDKKMVFGARKNLEFYELKGKVLQANALYLDKTLKKNSIDAIATDPPYGRSSHIGAKNIKELYAGFLKSAHRVLKKGRFCAFFCPHFVRLRIEREKWNAVRGANLYVHGGLIRKVVILRKK